MLKHSFHHKTTCCILLWIASFNCIAITAIAQEQDISIKVKPFKQDCVYSGKEEAGYHVQLKNLNKEPQKGTLTITVDDKDGDKEYARLHVDLNLARGGIYSKSFSLGINKFPPGFYKTNLIINTDAYDDTISYIFGI